MRAWSPTTSGCSPITKAAFPDAGDSFTFAVGRRRSVTITRDDSGQIRAYHNPIANGLNPCHVGTAEGHIFVNLSASDEPPDFESAVADFRVVGQRHATAELKVGARRSLPMYANWKLALENFLECYHCGPAHAHLVTVHDADLTMSPERKAELAPKLAQWVPPSVRPGGGGTGMAAGGSADDVSITGRAYLLPGVVTASLDGKPVAPLLPPFDDYTHGYRETSTAWSTGYWAAYDDYVVTTRFTPRDVELTDVELLWLVHPDAEEGVDYDVDNLTALWEITVQEDIWVCENNQIGIRSGGYELGRYATHESGRGSPAGFVAWYMAAIAGDVGRIDTY